MCDRQRVRESLQLTGTFPYPGTGTFKISINLSWLGKEEQETLYNYRGRYTMALQRRKEADGALVGFSPSFFFFFYRVSTFFFF